MRNRRGFIFIEIVMGMTIVAILAAILGSAAAMRERSLLHLRDSRTATHQAESALLTMQSHQKPVAGSGEQLSFKKLQDSPQAAGMAWIEVRATVHTRAASLIGLVPQDSIPDGAK